MKRRSSRPKHQEPSLVPLADMLANTVGIMLFILAFTVLTTGGATVAKRLPLLHETKAEQLNLLCVGDQVCPIDAALQERFPKPPSQLTMDSARAFVRAFNGAQIEDEFVVAKGRASIEDSSGGGKHLQASVAYQPKPGKGLAVRDLEAPGSFFMEMLRTNDPGKIYFDFNLRPESLPAFYQARAIAVRSNFACGWFPINSNAPLVMNVIGRGAASGPQ